MPQTAIRNRRTRRLNRRLATTQEPLDEAPASRTIARKTSNRHRHAGNPERSLRERTAAAAMGRRAAPPRPRRSDPASRPSRRSTSGRGQREEAPSPGAVRSGVVPPGWNSDRYFEGGSALNWSGESRGGGDRRPRSVPHPAVRDPVQESVAASTTPSRWMRAVSTWCGFTLPSRTGALRADRKVMQGDGSSP